MGQGLLHGDDIVDIAVVVVVDDGQGGALHVHDIVHISAVNGHFLIVVVILGGLIGGQASALQQGGQGVVILRIGSQSPAVDQVPGLAAGLNDQQHILPAQIDLLEEVLGIGCDVLAVEIVHCLQRQQTSVGVV